MTPPLAAAPEATAVLIPVKSFDLAKGRLADALGGAERADLARSMAARVVAAADPLPTFVVCSTDEVTAWAEDHGVEPIRFDQPGLNPAVTAASATLAQRGFGRLIIAHGDLPLARDLSWLAEDSWTASPSTGQSLVLIVTDRHEQGTNVLSVPLGIGFRYFYGEDSAAAHRGEAERLGLTHRTVTDPELSWDVDRPEDLDLPETADQPDRRSEAGSP